MNKKLLSFLWIIPALAAFGVYYNALSNGFIWDDPIVLKNQLSAFRSIKDVFFPPSGIPQFGIHYYRPLIILSFLIDKKLWGSSIDAAFGFHLSVIIFHVIITVLVFFLVRRILKGSKYGSLAALVASLLFAVHPIHTESVSWMAGRSDVLTALFFFISLWFYMKHLETNDRLWLSKHTGSVSSLHRKGQNAKMLGDGRSMAFLLLSVLAFLISAFAKETALSLILLLPVIDLAFSSRLVHLIDAISQGEDRKRKGEKSKKKKQRYAGDMVRKISWWSQFQFKSYIAFVGAAVVYFLMRNSALKEPTRRPFQSDVLLELPRNFINSYGFYLEKLFFPVNLKAYIPEVPSGIVFTLLSIVVLVALIVLALWALSKNRKTIFFAIAFFLLTLLPSIMVAVIKVSETPLAERYLYIPSFAFSLMAGILALYVPLKLKGSTMLRKAMSVIIVMVLVAVTAVYSVQTVCRNPVWKDDVLFWEDIVRKLPDEGLPHLNLGLAYNETDREKEAEQEYIKAIKANYDEEGRSTAYNNLGNIYMGREEFDRAEECFKTAITIRQNYATPYYSTALNYWKKFNSARRKGEQPDIKLPQMAIEYLNQALKLNPQYLKAHGLLGSIYFAYGKHDLARKHLETVLQYEQEGGTAEAARKILEKIPR
ncbi:MAG: tetratricopeptide repeat protein [Acidobacteriota bacterium]